MSQFRKSAYYDDLYLGVAIPLRFIIYEMRDGVRRPADLTVYDGGVKFQIYDSDSAPSLRQSVTLAVLTDSAEKVTDIDGTTLVPAKCSGSIVVSGAVGEVRVKIIGIRSGTSYLLGQPWKATIHSSGPAS